MGRKRKFFWKPVLTAKVFRAGHRVKTMKIPFNLCQPEDKQLPLPTQEPSTSTDQVQSSPLDTQQGKSIIIYSLSF